MSTTKKDFTETDRKRMKSMIYVYIFFGFIDPSLGYYFLEIVTKGYWIV